VFQPGMNIVSQWNWPPLFMPKCPKC